MIDVLKINIFPNNVVSGVATGYISDSQKQSYFETANYNSEIVLISRKAIETINTNEINHFYYQKQIHSDIVLIDPKPNSIEIIESDAIISNLSGILYNVSIADCQAILVYDPINNAIAAIHSGWKGTSLNIVGKTISKLIDTYGTNPSKLLVYLAPSACLDNYEVGIEFTELFPETTIKIEDKFYFDNRKEISNQLLEAGIRNNNIESNMECTITNIRYHSYRRDKNASGRMSAFIGIRAPFESLK